MKRIKIIADDKVPFLRGAFEEVAEIEYVPGKEMNNEIIKDADALLIRTRTKCNRQLLEGSKVTFIASATIGYDHIDTDYCDRKGIKWTNAPGCNSSSVEQYLTAALLTLADKHRFSLKDKTLGIVGVGNVGQKVSRIASSLGMKVLHNDPPREEREGKSGFHSLDDIRTESDIISFHVPLNLKTQHCTLNLANRDFLFSLKKNAIIINTSRGEIMDEPALKNALADGKVKDAVLDVWNNEPAPDRELLKLAGIATPHIAGYSVDGKAKGTEMSVRAISGFFDLGLENWKAKELPGTEIDNIVIDCGSMDEQEIISDIYLRTYEIMKDDASLRNDPGSFEDLRANYPVRREPSYYTVRLNNNPFENIDEILGNLGFSVLELDCFC